MKKGLLALAIFLGSATTVHADSNPTTITASPPASSTVGQSVTFTARFTFGCANGVAVHYFLIDRQQVDGNFVPNGQSATDTLTISSLTVGQHAVAYHWETSALTPGIAPCGGDGSILYTVKPKPAPPPPPPPAASPSETPSPSPSPSASPESPSPSPATTARLTAHAASGGLPVPAGLLVLGAAAAIAAAAFGVTRALTRGPR